MKTLTVLLLLSTTMLFTNSAFAGVGEYKPGSATEKASVINANVEVDLFGYSDNLAEGNDQYGGGIGINYFFAENLGVGLEGSYGSSGDEEWKLGASLIWRAPTVTLMRTQFASYAFIGAQGTFLDSGTDDEFQPYVGVGVDYPVSRGVKVFLDYRYVFGDEHRDTRAARLGLRFEF